MLSGLAAGDDVDDLMAAVGQASRTTRRIAAHAPALSAGCHLSGGADLAQTPDCERVRDHGMAQPVNTLTSAAYGVASLPVLFAARRSTGLLRIELHAYAGALLAVMAGSAQFHARGPGPSHRLHDGSLYAAVSLGSLLLLPAAGALADTRSGRRFLFAAATAGAAYACGRRGQRSAGQTSVADRS